MIIGDHRDIGAVGAAQFEHDLTVGQREQRVVLAHADIDAGMELGAALADENVAGQNGFTAIALDAQTLGMGIATVFGAAYAFFRCHFLISLR